MSYQKKNWQDLPNTTTPITATELNRMENGIADANGAIGADAYDSTATYAVNDLCIYNNTLYICTTAISTAEAWNSSHWKAVSINDMLISKTENNNVVTSINKMIDFDCLNGVVESGSNANGNWTKYGDGTMICNTIISGLNFSCTASGGGSGTYYYVDANNSAENVKIWNFPQAFKEGTQPTISLSVSSSGFTMASIGGLTNIYVTGYCVAPYPIPSTKFVWNFTAVGRWK